MRNEYIEFTCNKDRADDQNAIMNERKPLNLGEVPVLTDRVVADPNDSSTWELQ